MATQSTDHAWEFPWTEEPWRATIQGVSNESDKTEQLNINNKDQDLEMPLPCFFDNMTGHTHLYVPNSLEEGIIILLGSWL